MSSGGIEVTCHLICLNLLNITQNLAKILQLAVRIENFKIFLSATWLLHGQIVGHYREDSHTHLMLITEFLQFDPKVTRKLVTRLGSTARSSAWWDLNQET